MAQELKSYSVVASSETQNYLDGEIYLAFEAYDANEVDAVLAEKDAENRRLKRALYKACANWAKSERYTEATWHGDEHREELWANVQAKCRAKAEEYK